MAFQVPRICVRCGKEPKAVNGIIRMRLTPEAVCYECEPWLEEESESQQIERLTAERHELLETLKAVRDAGKGLFLVLDPRAGVGERMSIVWDRLNATIWKIEPPATE